HSVDLREVSSGLDRVFEDIGKADGVNRLVKRVYQYNTLDKRIAHFFDLEMIDRFESMFGSFLIGLLGGKPYNRITMIRSHRSRVNLSDQHFNAFLDNITIALMHEKIPHSSINMLVELMEKTREDVCGRSIIDTCPNRNPSFPSQSHPHEKTIATQESQCQCAIQ
ncbi:hypothetical protein DSO57_1037879, partial [Entomophthora muscae]